MSVWNTVCNQSDLVENSGVCALLNQQQIALFLVSSSAGQQVFGIQNYDPYGKANVMYRGLLGSVGERLYVASPLLKQRFCLTSGECIDDTSVTVRVYPTRIQDGQIQVMTD